MAWPETRLTDYDALSQVKSADLDSLQDAIIRSTHPERVLQIPHPLAFPHGGTFSLGVADRMWLSGASPSLFVPINLKVGDIIESVTVFGHESATDAYSALLWEADRTGSRDAKGGTKTSGTTDSWTTIGWNSSHADIPLTIASGKAYFVEVVLPATNVRYSGTDVNFRRPL